MPTFTANLGQRLPGRTRQGSHAYFRKQATVSARGSMAGIVRRYELLIRNLESATPDIVRNALEPVFQKALEYVPKKTGALAASGKLEVTGTPGDVEGTITFGDAKSWYAALVHEYVWLNHEPPTRAKYLQAALEEELDSFLTSLAVDYAMVLG